MKSFFIAFGVILGLASSSTSTLGAAPAVLTTLSVPPTALKPADYRNDILPWVSNSDAFYFANNVSAPVTSYANVPLNLPQGARIKGLAVYYTDYACGVNQKLVVTLQRHEMATGKLQPMAMTTTDGVPCMVERRVVEDKTIVNAVIDNDRYSYTLSVVFYDGVDRLRFNGAVLSYL
jgi:hypothetical protein